jgi:imidazolonepropionase-like amidohydrolase
MPALTPLLVLLALLVPSVAPPADDVLAVVDVTVVPMDAERHLEHQTVVVAGGVIAALGPVDAVTVPEGATRIDGRGRFLAPGLHDMHVHAWIEDGLLLFVANGVTTVRNMWGSPMQLSWKSRVESGELLGPHMITAGPIMDGDPPLWNGSTVVTDTGAAARYVASQAEAGYDGIKVYNGLTREVYLALVDAAREHDLPVWGHVPDAVGLVSCLGAEQDSVEHLTGFGEALLAPDAAPAHPGALADRWDLLTERDEDRTAKVAAMLAGSSTWNCPTLVVYRKFVPAEEGRELLAAPEMRFVDPSTRASWDPDTDFRSRSLTDEHYAGLREADAERLEVVRALHEAGAKLLLGTDTPNPYVVPGFAIHEELELLVRSGLSPYEAALAGTRDAACFLGRCDTTGVVAAGMLADLVLLDADPLDSVTAWRRPELVVVAGRAHTRAELDGRLEELAQRYEANVDPWTWLAGQPSLPEDATAYGRYETSFNDKVAAVEDAALVLGTGGPKKLTSRYAPSPSWGAPAQVDLRWHDDGMVTGGMTSRVLGEEASVDITLADMRLELEGMGAWSNAGATLDLDGPSLISLPPVSSRVPVWTLLPWATAGGRSWTGTVVGLRADGPLSRTVFEVTYRPAGERPVDDERVQLVYDLTWKATDGSQEVEGTLVLDPDDPLLLVELELRHQMGVQRTRRVE